MPGETTATMPVARPKLENRLFVLVLQHPQERTRELGTGRLLVERLAQARLSVGLSWPNLKKALGRDGKPSEFGVLYLGAARDKPPRGHGPLVATTPKGEPLADQRAALDRLKGFVILDGNWAQSKTLWWRNPWLLRLQRLILLPDRPSEYGRLRREPRGGAIATIEAAAMTLRLLEGRPELEEALRTDFRDFLAQFRAPPTPSA